jgi:hypothetical protein
MASCSHIPNDSYIDSCHSVYLRSDSYIRDCENIKLDDGKSRRIYARIFNPCHLQTPAEKT